MTELPALQHGRVLAPQLGGLVLVGLLGLVEVRRPAGRVGLPAGQLAPGVRQRRPDRDDRGDQLQPLQVDVTEHRRRHTDHDQVRLGQRDLLVVRLVGRLTGDLLQLVVGRLVLGRHHRDPALPARDADQRGIGLDQSRYGVPGGDDAPRLLRDGDLAVVGGEHTGFGRCGLGLVGAAGDQGGREDECTQQAQGHGFSSCCRTKLG
ncbi:hypothetical protein HDA39_000367 [Kribbella italica]|uniref:Uncharacterized protein n=1 Tax=Kribbella italica TaxID=1540520 RepID=A0A7W9J120_9ACTN|nr:hypothetical protein [Kribbella italica]MBB5833633.1 hypothetical protein [Kribbella italica]